MASFTLRPLPPYRLDLTVWVLRRLPINHMDRWDGQTYRSVLPLGSTPVEVRVVQTAPPESPTLEVTTHGGRTTSAGRRRIEAQLDKMLGTHLDLSGFYRVVKSDRRLTNLVQPFIGFRPPRLGSVFEAIVNGIACQQLSLLVGITLLNRLSAAYGLAVGPEHAFPRPEDLAAAEPANLRELGFSGRKGETILTIARAVADGQLDLEALAELDDASALARLRGLRGIGRWTAQYVLLRGLGRLDVFPADDIGSQNKFRRWLKLDERPDYDAVYRILEHWRPYRGMLYFCLLLDHMARSGTLQKPTADTGARTELIAAEQPH
jgi:DNA-3-methyladenine glycosylase II